MIQAKELRVSGGKHFSTGKEDASFAPNTTNPFSPDYQDPALSARQRKRMERRSAHADDPEGSSGRGWTLLYIVAAFFITVIVWFLFGGGV